MTQRAHVPWQQSWCCLCWLLLLVRMMAAAAAAAATRNDEDLTTSATTAANAGVPFVGANAEHAGGSVSHEYDDSYDDNIYSHRCRHLAASSDAALNSDYTVLGVLVMTLGLIIVVEVLRHYLDHLAKTRPFFQAVLRGVYTELSTLGMVELVVWLLHSYYDNLNLRREQVFAKVHFCLFYTALLNALQSVLLALLSMRLSRRLWVQTELLELNHYVELREEFDRVHEQLGLPQNTNRKSSTKEKDKDDDNDDEDTIPEPQQYTTLSFLSYVWSLIRHYYYNHIMRCHHDNHHHHHHHHYPLLLHRKYRRLLVQVRFHELRIQFLQAYQLPLALKISNYLWRSQIHVLINLVHVNMTAWLLLTMLANVLFVGIGLVLYETQDAVLVGTVMTCIFFSCLVGFVLLALLIHRKMESIFDSIMTQKDLWETATETVNDTSDAAADDDADAAAAAAANNDCDDDGHVVADAVAADRHADDAAAAENGLAAKNDTDKALQPQPHRADKQLELFWFSDPSVVMALVQFMQFGYALALSIVIIFADVIDNGLLGIYWYLIVIAVSYVVFVMVVARVIPRYTLCTSLGQLVNDKRLHETVAEFHLEEAKLRQKDEDDLRNFRDRVVQVESLNDKTGDGTASTTSAASLSAPGMDKDVDETSFLSGAVGATSLVKQRPSAYHEETHTRVRRHDAELIANLVKLDTASLRPNLPENEQQQLVMRDERRRRRKAVSEGVGAMSRMRSLSGGVSSMARIGTSSGDASSRTRDDMDVAASRRRTFYSAAAQELRADDTSPEQLSARFHSQQSRRRGRQKTVSDGVAFMAKIREGVHDDGATATEKLPTRAELRAMGRSMSLRHDPNPFGEHRLPPSQNTQSYSSVPSGLTLSDGQRPSLASAGDAPRLTNYSMQQFTEQSLGDCTDTANMSSPSSITGGSHAPTEHNMSAHNSVAQIEPGPSNGDDEDFSIRSEGGRSDVDDIPSTAQNHLYTPDEPTERQSWRCYLRTYFLSRRFIIVSNVFGTLAAFFFVGERIASFLYTEGITDPTEVVSFHFNNAINFWMLFGLLCTFLVTTFLILFSLGSFKSLSTDKERIVYVSAMLDILISATCLTVLTISEVQRCCFEDAESSRADVPPLQTSEFASSPSYPVKYGTQRLLAPVSPVDVPDPPTCSCPAFGSRDYGGLGTIEPFTVLVGLRILRFWTAKRLILTLKSYFSPVADVSEARKRRGIKFDPLSVSADMDDSPMTTETGSIVELWETAVSRYPHIVARHGEFSGELLQAMLGVTSSAKPQEGDIVQGAVHEGPDDSRVAASYEIHKQYHGLSTRAQEIIMSGAMGKSMRAAPSESMLDGFGRGSVIHEGLVSDQSHLNDATRFQPASSVDASYDYDGRFLCPEACLVRSMRRCDRKLLPMLDTWILVDVVMTRYEIVYFEAEVVDQFNSNAEADDIKEALVATKGGKGTRLCDIAAGRRVVGQLALSDIIRINVEREMPCIYTGKISTEVSSDETQLEEYWGAKDVSTGISLSDSREASWSSVKQDILVIQSRDGRKLHFRFYSDLNSAREHPEQWMKEIEDVGPLYKDNALQWAQCLARYCGQGQLRQSLPHFGDDTDNELRDYLIVRYDDTRAGRERRRGGQQALRRMTSFRYHRRQKTAGLPEMSEIQHTIHSLAESPTPASKPRKLTGTQRSISMDGGAD